MSRYRKPITKSDDELELVRFAPRCLDQYQIYGIPATSWIITTDLAKYGMNARYVITKALDTYI